MDTLKWAAKKLHITTSDTATTLTASETSLTSPSPTARRDFDCYTAYQFYNILRQRKIESWCQWHLIINGKDEAIKISKEFHQDFEKNKSSQMKNEIRIIEKTFLKFMPSNLKWIGIREIFGQASDGNCPLMFIKAYTKSQEFTEHTNNNSAANTYHAVKIYCTIVNCPILARTQEYTDAVTSIFFHQALDKLLIDRDRTVYRGYTVEDEKMLNSYEVGATILTTTQLSTSMNREVAMDFAVNDGSNRISVFCTYKLYKTSRRTALNIASNSQHPDEAEILILRYVPFTITSINWTDNRHIRNDVDDQPMQVSINIINTIHFNHDPPKSSTNNPPINDENNLTVTGNHIQPEHESGDDDSDTEKDQSSQEDETDDIFITLSTSDDENNYQNN